MAIKNQLVDLNNHLFEELERLNDDDLTGEQLQEEIQRAKAISEVGEKIIDNANLVLKAVHEQNEYGAATRDVPTMLLGVGHNEKME